MINNVAVFVNGQREFKGVNTEVTDDEVIVKNRVSGAEMARYSVVRVAKAGMAWDTPYTAKPSQEDPDPQPGLASLVVQQGCGCGGMLPYETDAQYDGPFKRAPRTSRRR